MMGLFENFGEKQAIKLIQRYTGQTIIPQFITSCRADIEPDWRGVAVLDNHSIWLVNRQGARGVKISNIAPDSSNGQYPPGSNGYPNYRYRFLFVDGQGSFTIFPITQDSGREMEIFLKRFE